MYRAVSFGCLGEDVSMNKYQPRAEMTNVTLFRLKELKRVALHRQVAVAQPASIIRGGIFICRVSHH